MRSRDSLLRLHRFRTDDVRRQAADIDMMIQDLMRKHDDLEQHIKFEEQRTGITDVKHVNYSMAAKSSRVRLENLLKSVGELRDQHESIMERVKDEESELRKVEMLVEKEGGSLKPLPAVPPPGALIGQAISQ
jgi:flagellar protein FliJ